MVRTDGFDLDLEAIEAAITERTRMVMVNTPNNPTGRIYPAETLAGAGGHPPGGGGAQRPARVPAVGRGLQPDRLRRPNVREPGGALRAVAARLHVREDAARARAAAWATSPLPPGAPDRDAIERRPDDGHDDACGWAFPVSLLQQALPDLQRLSIDLRHLQEKRDRMVSGLREAGYELHVPEGTFYLLPKSPMEDDWPIHRQARRARRPTFCRES